MIFSKLLYSFSDYRGNTHDRRRKNGVYKEFNKEVKRIILSHSRIFEDEAKAEVKKAAKKAAKAEAKAEEAAPAASIEKTTLGDIEELAALKEKLSKK